MSWMHRLEMTRVFLVLLLQAGVRAEVGVLGHVGGVPAGRRRLANRLGQAPDVVRSGAAADAEIAYPQVVGRFAEFGHFVAATGEGIERRGKRHASGNRRTRGVA